MKYDISKDRHTLTITADDTERAELAELQKEEPDKFGTWESERDAMEIIMCNSELQWGWPEDCGDLTDAPILEIHGDPDSAKDHLNRIGLNRSTSAPVMERWGYPHYCLRSFLVDLVETGKAEFVDAW